uniref:CvfB family protein n=1 Tax=Alistipes sp. TaxID=1872444 RepID=UPI0040575E42
MRTGEIQRLTVARISDFGLYLKDDEGAEVLLPNRFTRLDMKEGDEVEVFVYHDSEDRLVASTEKPLIKVGEVAALKVVDKSIHGAFLDWGLSGKHLFLPNRNQQGGVIAGQLTVVYMYVDERTGRCVATNKIKPFIYNDDPLTVKVGDEVDVLVAFETPIGYRVVIDNRHWAMIYKNQLFRPIRVGDRCRGWVRKITEDMRIDVSLQQQGLAEVETSVVRLEKMLKEHGGVLSVNDHSDPQDVARLTGMSKKVFKRALGMLLKQGKVRQTEFGIETIKR